MAQSIRQSWYEIGIDFAISIAMSLSIQALFIHSFTLMNGISYSCVFLSIALTRRYIVRRSFNIFVKTGVSQSRFMSLVETTTDTAFAIAIAFGMTALWYPDETLQRVTSLIVASYVLAFARRYALRRLFEWLPHRHLATVSRLT